MADRILLIRHGETEWSVERRHTGRTDLPLDADGERRARLLGPILGREPGIAAARVLSSPLRRARQTCELAGLGDRAEIVDDLAEWDYGEFEGTRTADLQVANPAWSIWTAAIERGESLAEVGERVDRVIDILDSTAGLIVLFAHAHLLRILAARWCGWPPIGGRHLTVLPASVSALAYEREIKVIERWNASPDESEVATADRREGLRSFGMSADGSPTS